MKSTISVSDLMNRLASLNLSSEEYIKSQNGQALESQKYSKTFWDIARGMMPKNALKEGSDGSGGFLVPDEFEQTLVQALENENILRRLGNVIQTKHNLKIPTVVSHGAAAWVQENEQINDSDDTFGQIVLSAYKLGTRMILSEELLEDSGFDLETYIIQEFARRIGKKEEESFMSGDGIGKPTGLLLDAPVGAVSVEAGTLCMDDVIELYHSIGQRYRMNATWLMSGDAYRTLRKCRTAMGKNIWESSAIKDAPFMLLGRPVEISDAMPEIAAGMKPVLFGDFSYYWIGDRGKRSLKRLNELFADKGQVGFQATQRVDAKLVLPKAIKALEIKVA